MPNIPKQKAYDALVVAHGILPSKVCLRALAEVSKRVLVLDGAADRMIAMSLWPHIILGDLDSISDSALKSARRHGTRIVQIKEQETSDLEKGLRFCLQRKWKRIAVVGFLGHRLDHTLNAFGIFSKFTALKITLIAAQSIGQVLHGKLNFRCTVQPGQQISLIPLPVARGVTLAGVKWPLRNRVLCQSGEVSLSNTASDTTVTIRQSAGCCLFVVNRRKQIFLDCNITT
jgi:thiamine pyrophosphokinase